VSNRNSPIVEHHGSGRLRAGDRAPDAELRDENNQARRIFELIREPRHVLLIFLGAGGDGGAKSEGLGAAIHGLPEGTLDTYRIGRGWSDLPAELRDISGLAHAAYGLPNGGVALVRPDGYLGYRSDDFAPAKVRDYLTRIFSLPLERSPVPNE